MITTLRCRLYPTKTQIELIDRTIGCARLVYNKGLDFRKTSYKNGSKVNHNDTSKMLTSLKQDSEYSFLREVDAAALQQSLKNLDSAYQKFFKEHTGYPKFKSKKYGEQSYRTINQKSNNVRIENNRIKLPKIGWVKIKLSKPIPTISSATIKRTPTNKYFISLVYEADELSKCGNNQIGLDVGIKNFCNDSNGNKIDNHKFYKSLEAKLKREQRKLSRMIYGSKNYNKQRIKVSLIYERITNTRKDFLQKLSTQLINENQVICVENLNIKGMVKNHKLAKCISDVSWGQFFRMLEYKSQWRGATVIKVPTFYPSSQTCNICGYINTNTKNLNVRSWVCPNCGTKHDRDTNAAINILKKGLETYNQQTT